MINKCTISYAYGRNEEWNIVDNSFRPFVQLSNSAFRQSWGSTTKLPFTTGAFGFGYEGSGDIYSAIGEGTMYQRPALNEFIRHCSICYNAVW